MYSIFSIFYFSKTVVLKRLKRDWLSTVKFGIRPSNKGNLDKWSPLQQLLYTKPRNQIFLPFIQKPRFTAQRFHRRIV